MAAQFFCGCQVIMKVDTYYNDFTAKLLLRCAKFFHTTEIYQSKIKLCSQFTHVPSIFAQEF